MCLTAHRRLAVAVLIAALPAFGQGVASGDTASGDTAAVRLDSARSDTTGKAVQLPVVDPVLAWTRWPAIAPAIALQRLDGPEDVLEKEEIIADRIDDLAAEATRLDTLDRAWRARHLAMSTQLEVLDDLAEVQLGGDLELQQRVESVRQDVEQAARRLAVIDSSRHLLGGTLERLQGLSHDYRLRAERLRAEEEAPR